MFQPLIWNFSQIPVSGFLLIWIFDSFSFVSPHFIFPEIVTPPHFIFPEIGIDHHMMVDQCELVLKSVELQAALALVKAVKGNVVFKARVVQLET